MSVNASRVTQVRSGIRIETFTIIWMVIEAIVSIGAGIIARSALLTAFGLDSVKELISGAILLWHLLVEANSGDIERVERSEHRAAWVVGISLALLCLYILLTAIYGLVTHTKPGSSPVGITISIAAVLVMP